jgi:hypothetical protein
MKCKRFFKTMAAAMLAAAPGCVSDTPQRARPQTEVTYGNQSPARPPAQSPSNSQTTSDLGPAGPMIFNDFSRATDPCAAQLQDLSEALLLYYAVKKHLPQSLDELAPYASAGTQLQLKCPISGEPYIYNRNGPLLNNSLYLTDNTGRSVSVANQMSLGHMVIYDASPAHKGERWAIVFGMDTRGSTPVASPFRIPEKAFQDAVRASPGR